MFFIKYNEYTNTYDLFEDTYIETYIEKHESQSAWNKMQLHVLLMTIIGFIDEVIDISIKHGYLDLSKTILNDLKLINDTKGKDEKLMKQLFYDLYPEKVHGRLGPLWFLEFRHKINLEIIRDLCKDRLSMADLHLRLRKLQNSMSYGRKKKSEVHQILDEHFTLALNAIEQFQNSNNNENSLTCASDSTLFGKTKSPIKPVMDDKHSKKRKCEKISV